MQEKSRTIEQVQGQQEAPSEQAALTAAEAMQETLAAYPAAAMAQTAASVAVSPPMGAVPPPTLTDCILCDHDSTLTLFKHFFQAAHTGNAYVMDMCTSSLALEMRMHSQAENLVLYPLLQARLGDSGSQWAARALAEHSMIERSIGDVMTLRAVGGEALINRMKQMQTEFVTHQAEEESQILPAVAAVLSAEEQVALAAQFKAARQTAPLTPQPASVMAQAAQLLSQQAPAAAGPAPVSGTAAGTGAGPGTVTTGGGELPIGGVGGSGEGMEMGGDVASPEGGELEMGSGSEPPPAGSKAVEAGVTPPGMEAEA